ncbi:MAG: efflux RND transporter periplasmic adaptor subunit [Rhodoferax sp.]
MKPRLFSRRLALAALGAVLVAVALFASLRTGPLAPTQVTLTQPRQGVIKPTLFGIGTVEARRSWMVGPTAPARVLQVWVDVGDRVHAGQLLAEMDPVDLDQRLSALESGLARAQSVLRAAQSQLSDAAARHQLSVINAQRNRDLARQHFISDAALDAKLQEQASAQAALQTALANVDASAQDLARLKAERAALVQQRQSLRLLAPANAVVSTRDAEAGSTVVAGQPVLRLLDPDSAWVRLRVDQGRSAGLAVGLAARIVRRSQPQTVLTGRVARLEVLADSVTEERIAQVAFDTPPADVSVGELAEVTLLLPDAATALLLPNAAIQHWAGQTGVWRIEEGKPQWAPVQLGVQDADGQVQVLSGVSAADRVVVYSQKALEPGARIKVVDALVAPGGAR